VRAATILAAGALLLGAALGGCGGAGGGDAFGHIYPDNEPSQVDSVVRRLSAATPAADDAVAVGLTESELFVYDLSGGRERWRQPVAEPRGEPQIAGPLVLLHEGDRVVARRLADGRRAFDVGDDHLQLVGSAGEGAIGAFVLSTTGGVGASSRLFVTSGDSIARRYDADLLIGAPEVAAGMIFVPWGHQNVTVIDAASGEEIARLRSLAGVVGHARVEDGTLFFGQAGVGRLVAGLRANDPEQIGWVAPDTSSLPGAPPFFRSSYDPPASANSATHRIELAWRPTPGDGAVGFSDDTVYLTFYKLVFGLAPDDLSVRWVAQLDADAVGATARPGGVVVADASGGLSYLAASNGQVQWSGSLGVQPTVVSMRVASFAPSGSPGEEPGFLAEQLLSAVQNTDARLVPGRAFAVRALAAQPDDAVTEHLIVLCDDRALPGPLRTAACEALGTRDSGIGAVMRALQRHAAFLEGTEAPPVGALASAAANMGERAAVPLLVSHLVDPDTAIADVPRVAAALATLGDRSAVESLRDFLWLYHADGSGGPLAAALAGVARAIVVLDGPPGREVVGEVLQAPFTAPPVRQAINDMLSALAEAEAAEAEPADDEEPDPDAEEG